jgi:smad nuclear-interacting protein 1
MSPPVDRKRSRWGSGDLTGVPSRASFDISTAASSSSSSSSSTAKETNVGNAGEALFESILNRIRVNVKSEGGGGGGQTSGTSSDRDRGHDGAYMNQSVMIKSEKGEKEKEEAMYAEVVSNVNSAIAGSSSNRGTGSVIATEVYSETVFAKKQRRIASEREREALAEGGGMTNTGKYGETLKKEEGKHISGRGKTTIDDETDADITVATEAPQLANFGLTGALAKDKAVGNTVNGVVLKWSEPKDAIKPSETTGRWRIYVFHVDVAEPVDTLYIHRQASYLFGRDSRVCDINLDHISCSKQHAVIQYRSVPLVRKSSDSTGAWNNEVSKKRVILPYLMDLNSTQRTYLNGTVIESSRYYELQEQDCVTFGKCTTEYVLVREK